MTHGLWKGIRKLDVKRTHRTKHGLHYFECHDIKHVEKTIQEEVVKENSQ